MRRRVLLVLVLVACSVPLLFAESLAPFTATDLEGNVVTSSVFEEKPLTMVFVWATYCGYCKQEMPSLVKMQKLYGGKFQIIGIVTDALNSNGSVSASQVKSAQNILKKYGFDVLTLLPSPSLEEKLLNGIAGVPVAWFVDSEGEMLTGPIYGMQSERALKKTITGLLQQ
jgi:thiol-disulfide isomerase/thioredoxin